MTKAIKVSLIFLGFSPALFINSLSGQDSGWKRATLELNDSSSLVIPMLVSKAGNISEISIFNGIEKITASEVSYSADSIRILFPVFDSEIKARIREGQLSGKWCNYSRKEKNEIPFKAIPDGEIIKRTEITPGLPVQKFEMVFGKEKKLEDRGLGLFTVDIENLKIYGTVLTESGDYRYLSGVLEKKSGGYNFSFGLFNGAQAYLFKGTMSDDLSMKGMFYSGKHWADPFTAEINPGFELRDPDSLASAKKGHAPILFSLENTSGKMISPGDEKFQGKALIIQILGSWCPNCLDETEFFSENYREIQQAGVEIIGVSFEKGSDRNRSMENLRRLDGRFNTPYDLCLAELPASTANAAKLFPMLNKVVAFPTTIYIDKHGNIRKVFTGFTGPATGEYYQRWKETTIQFIYRLGQD